jgi:hypothetical protein
VKLKRNYNNPQSGTAKPTTTTTINNPTINFNLTKYIK